MPLLPFAALPDDARTWVFGSTEAVRAGDERALLASVDEWLEGWQAHGHPLTCAREWRDGRFLVVGVDQRTAGASGCSIDALFHVLRTMQAGGGTSFLGGGRVFYRDAQGAIVCIDRARLRDVPGISESTPVFDTALTSAAEYRAQFERPLSDSWHRELLQLGTTR
jgi:hypothetical protein